MARIIEGDGIERSLGFQLKMLQLRVEAAARQALAGFDLSPARASALLLIRANPGCTQSALGAALAVNRASAMKIVNFLEQRGLVTRGASSDPRAHALYLTQAGEQQLAGVSQALDKVDEQILATLSASDAGELFRLLGLLRANLDGVE